LPEKDTLSSWWLLVYPVIAIVSFLLLYFVFWPDLPDPFPTHMNALGEIDGWTAKTTGGFILLLLFQWIILAMFASIFFIIKKAKRQITPDAPEETLERDRRFRGINGTAIFIGGIIMGVFMFTLPLLIGTGASNRLVVGIIFGFMGIIAVFCIVLYLRVGQGGSRLKSKVTVDVTSGQSRTTATSGGKQSFVHTAIGIDDDSCWKLGQFYFNKEDPSLFVEKRFGVGWTFNYARPASWLILGGLLAIVVVSLVLSLGAAG
jgi:uncharacterized membrane protein